MGFLKKDGRGRPDFHETPCTVSAISGVSRDIQAINKNFPTHDQLLANSGHAGEGHLLTSSCGPRASASLSPSGFRVRKVERKRKHLPRLLLKKDGVKSWPTGSTMSTGQDFTPKPYLSMSSFCMTDTGHFRTVDFFLPQENCPSSRGGPDPSSHLHAPSETDSLCLLQMLLCLCC